LVIRPAAGSRPAALTRKGGLAHRISDRAGPWQRLVAGVYLRGDTVRQIVAQKGGWAEPSMNGGGGEACGPARAALRGLRAPIHHGGTAGLMFSGR